MDRYKVVGPCEVAGVAPGGIVTREQYEKCVVAGTSNFDVLVGPHLEKVTDDEQDEAPQDPQPVVVEPPAAGLRKLKP